MTGRIIREARLADGSTIDILVEGGQIVELGTGLSVSARVPELDARGLLALPGVVDSHVHFNEPGPRTGWEGWATGSAAAAAGGVTTVVEMPLNASPPTVDTAIFDRKVASAAASSHVDFGLWGGVIPGNRDQLRPLAERGVIGFKAFVSDSGVADFPAADTRTLLEAMETIAETGLTLAVHAESDEITSALALMAISEGRLSMRDYLASRPIVAETEAIARLLELARATSCSLHIVHISSARGVELVSRARDEGLAVSCEVTPHHLLLDAEDAVRLGAVAKCAPPLRDRAEGDQLWAQLLGRMIDWIASDHSPAPPELLSEADLFASWGGIAAVQSSLELLLTDGRLPLELITEVTASAPADRLSLAGKGHLEVGADADLALVQLGPARELLAGELRSRHRRSPYLGRTLTAQVRHTLLRGEPIGPAEPPRGKLLTPGRRVPDAC
jgi:allantoinase